MRRKKLFLIPSIFAVIFSVCALSSCGDCIGTNGGNSSIETKISVDIEKDVYDVKLGEITTLHIFCEGQETLVVSSTNENVAYIDENGFLRAVGVGSTTITATYGKETDECIVNVGFANEMPRLVLQQIEGEEVKVVVGNNLYFNGEVLFGNQSYTNGEWGFISSNPQVGEIDENGEFLAKTIGETDVPKMERASS